LLLLKGKGQAGLKVAIVHDWLNQVGGAEAVLGVLKEMYPQAPVYTSIYWPAAMPAHYHTWDIRPSFMDKLPLVKRHHQAFLPLYPLAFEQFDLSEYDLVISNKSAFCHGVITPPQTTHICYCLTPTRFLWNIHEYVEQERVGSLARAVLPLFLNYLRLWDRLAADRVDHFAAISRTVQARIRKIYRRESTIIHPPVDVGRFTPSEAHDETFLIVSRLIPYKRLDIAVRAFNQLGLPLMIVGDGRDRARLEALAEPNVRFLGRLPDGEVRKHLARCRALIFPGLEDFGLTPIEAQAAGRPVIAYAGGGALETVVEGVTGTFFHEQSPEALAEVVAHFDDRRYDPQAIRQHAARFGVAVFKEKFGEFVREKLAKRQSSSEFPLPRGTQGN
jgi:glycosyltransferase involved in cell wall biosynthesis